jgi:hypothetical protein
VTFFSNVCCALKEIAMLDQRWKLASNNYNAIVEAISVYGISRYVAAVLFTGVVLGQGAAAVLFARAAAFSLGLGSIDHVAANAAFVVGVGFWGALMIADEVFLQYERQASHATLFIAQLASWMALYLLPD